MIVCPECGAAVSDRAPTCPNCGCPPTQAPRRPDTSGWQAGIIGGTIAMVIGAVLVGSMPAVGVPFAVLGLGGAVASGVMLARAGRQ